MPSLSLPLVTERLLLRPFETGDVDDMHAYQRLPEVTRYLYRPARSRERCAEMIAQSRSDLTWETDGEMLAVAICRRDRPGVIGELMLRLESARARQFEVGWALHPGHGGHGYATEAARALVGAAFAQLAAHRVFARLDADNIASVRLCERLGMRREAHLIENDLDLDGRWGSEYVYALLAREHFAAPLA